MSFFVEFYHLQKHHTVIKQNYMKSSPLLFAIIILSWACGAQSDTGPNPIRVKGVSLVASPSEYTIDPMIAMAEESAANWVTLVPYGFTPANEPYLYYNMQSHQWWGETDEGIIESIRLARKQELKILLKPQVWSANVWSGDISFDDEKSWRQWEAAYTDYITHFAEIAEAHDVDMFCIGTEMKNAIADRPEYWISLCDTIRSLYSGKISYAANWDNYQQIPLWSMLDVIGINAYFPLVNDPDPQLEKLVEAWKPWLREMRDFYATQSKPILFTEFGYLAVDRAAWNTWELESQVMQLNQNDELQARCYEALFKVMTQESWWLGGMVWKWFPRDMLDTGRRQMDYTPQNSKSLQVLKYWYQHD